MFAVFDIGATFVKYACMNQANEILEMGKFRTPYNSLEELLDEMFRVINNYEKYQLKGISICCPGTVDIAKGVVYFGGWLSYLHEVNLKEVFYQKYKVPVSVENDGKAAALAEIWNGKKDSLKHAVVLVLGSAVGGGIIINGKLHRGHTYSAGEVSFMIGDSHDEYGRYKRWGYDASASKMVEDVAVANNLDSKTDGEIVFQYITKDNKESWEIFSVFCRKIGRMIISLQHILDPQKFIVCGGICAQPIVCETILNEIKEIYRKNPEYTMLPIIENSKLGSDANLHGALYHFFEEYEEIIR